MIGRVLRQYVVTEQLGQGGMGVVWKAHDTTLDRDVALKVLPAEFVADLERRERLLREAKAASALNHPNVVTIYEINSVDDLLFIAMEFVPGRTLASLLASGPLGVAEAVGYATQIAEGMGRAHRAGIIHRDLKPGNVIVGEDNLLKVLDFGLAKIAAPQDDGETTGAALTRAGMALGTLGYMSPEQSFGEPADARSDVFSFGAMFYQMLAGVLPFAGSSQAEVLRHIHFDEPRPLHAIRPDVPPTVVSIIARALSKKPADRYANMGDVAVELRQLTRPSTAPGADLSGGQPRWASSPLRRWRPGRVGAALIAASVIAVTAAIMWWTLPRTQDSARVTTGTTPVAAHELSQQAAELLMRDDKEANVDQAIAVSRQAIQLDAQHAPAYAYLARAYIQKHQTSPDPQWLRLARDSADRAVVLAPDLALAHLMLALVHLQAGDKEAADPSLKRAGDLDPMNPNVVAGLGRYSDMMGKTEDAERLLRRAADLAPRDWHHPMRLGQFFYERARFDEAVQAWEAARALTPDNVLVLRNLTAVYFRRGQYDEAAASIQRALEVRPTAGTYTNLGTIRFFQGRYVEAVAPFEKAVELGANSHLMWANLADAYRWAPGRRADSVPAYRRAIALIREQIAKDPASRDLPTRHAVYLAKSGEVKAALIELTRVAPDAGLTAQMLYRMAVVYELAGERDRALDALERALRASYPMTEVAADPEMIPLRADARYHRLVNALSSPAR